MTAQPLPEGASFAAPDVTLTRDDGAEVQLASLWAERPLALAFFGDLANPFTGDNAAQLRDADEAFARVDGDIAAIVTASSERSRAFRQQYFLPYPLLNDAEGLVHTSFQVLPGASAQFVISTEGVVTFARHASNLADYPPTNTLVAAVCELTGAEPPVPPSPLLAMPQDAPLERVEQGNLVTVERYSCGKCGHNDSERGDIATAGGFLSRLFNLQHRKFTAVSCRACGYTELYKRTTGTAGNVIDFLAGA